MHPRMKFAFLAAVAALAAGVAHADTVTLTLLPPSATYAGETKTLTFDATASAPATNTGDVYLNGDSLNVQGPLTSDDSDFYVNFPLFLSPGGSVTGDLFTVTVPQGTPWGAYDGSFVLLGGSDSGALDSLATADFTVSVGPEPSSLVLLGSGSTLLGALVKRRLRVRRA